MNLVEISSKIDSSIISGSINLGLLFCIVFLTLQDSGNKIVVLVIDKLIFLTFWDELTL